MTFSESAEQLTSSQLLSNVGHSNDPVNIWRVKERQQSEGGGGGLNRKTDEGGMESWECQCIHWPILLSTKANDPGPPLPSPSLIYLS